MKNNIGTLIDTSKRDGLEVNTEKTKYLLQSHHQNEGKNHDIKKAKRAFQTMVKIKYFGNDSKSTRMSKSVKIRI
jgi:hypothetical protein